MSEHRATNDENSDGRRERNNRARGQRYNGVNPDVYYDRPSTFYRALSYLMNAVNVNRITIVVRRNRNGFARIVDYRLYLPQFRLQPDPAPCTCDVCLRRRRMPVPIIAAMAPRMRAGAQQPEGAAMVVPARVVAAPVAAAPVPAAPVPAAPVPAAPVPAAPVVAAAEEGDGSQEPDESEAAAPEPSAAVPAGENVLQDKQDQEDGAPARKKLKSSSKKSNN